MNIEISLKDRILLRDVAKQQLEYANTEINKNKKKNGIYIIVCRDKNP